MKKTKQIFKITNKVLDLILYKGHLDKKDISKYFDEPCSIEIIERLTNNSKQKERLELLNYVNQGKKEDLEKIRLKIKPSAKIKNLKLYYKIAAMLVISFGSLYFINNYFVNSKNITNQIASNNEKIILKLANGETKYISNKKNVEIKEPTIGIIKSKKSEILDYSTKHKKTLESIVYNELIIPYGKKFKLILSDGTEVHLNSGSILKYPVNFINENNREVFLTGEAYFKVAKDKIHPFIVHTDNLNVRVLGTEFNISSYPEDKNIFTVLVEGSVSLYDKKTAYNSNKTTLLSPGNKAKWNKKNSAIDIKKVNTDIYTSWIDGKLVIENIRFSSIIKRLERHYNVKIINKNNALAHQIFTATFKTESIEQVLESFKINFPFTYTINQKKIIIN